MHTIVVPRDLLESEPWLARSLHDAFRAAKAHALAALPEAAVLSVAQARRSRVCDQPL